MVSVYLLLWHLRKLYAFGDDEKELFRRFLINFYERWQDHNTKDTDILAFSDSRQQDANNVSMRHMILRQLYFEYATDQKHIMREKDTKRVFDESQRIALYRKYDGLCQECVREEKPRSECLVPWSQYDADHVIPHSKGGQTTLDNAELLCHPHNLKKGAGVGAGG